MIGHLYKRYAILDCDGISWSQAEENALDFHTTSSYNPPVYEFVFEEVGSVKEAEWFGWRGYQFMSDEVDFVSPSLKELSDCFWYGKAADKGYGSVSRGEIVYLRCISCDEIGRSSEIVQVS